MKITDVAIQLAPVGQDRLRGFCCITIDGCFVVRDIKVINGPNGLFVAMPSRKIMAGCSQCRTKNHLHARFCNQCGGPVAGDGARGGAGEAALRCGASDQRGLPADDRAGNSAGVQRGDAAMQQPGYVGRQLGDGGDSVTPNELVQT